MPCWGSPGNVHEGDEINVAAFWPCMFTQAMREVHRILKPALEGTMTSDVMKKAKAMGPDMLYFDDFLGDGDVDEHNRTLVTSSLCLS